MNYRWILRPYAPDPLVEEVSRSLNDLPKALARALVVRGIDSFERARHFFRPSLDTLHDPFSMADMDLAAARVVEAIERSEQILVYGDYDVDGTTATALLVSALRSMGAKVSYFIPDRFDDGYGLGTSGMDRAAARGADLIVAVDCGVTSIKEAAHARTLGLDLIVCDHHTPKEQLPDCAAVLDPKRNDCDYPFKELCGCAVAFKLVQAVLAKLGRSPEEANQYLDLVAVATASDIVPAQGENRVLLYFGLQMLRSTRRPGLQKLAELAGLDLDTASASNVVFTIGPRINAAGRLSSAEKAVELLLADDLAAAHHLASELEGLNKRRRDLDRAVLKDAESLAERQITSGTRHSIVLHREDWHLGVLGIVASRLVERFYKPVVLLGTSNGVAKGSARSINGVNVFDALCECRDLLLEFGGHDFAAGMSLEPANVDRFQRRFDEAVAQAITPELLDPVLHIDAVADIDHIDTRFWAVLKQFAPHGPMNDRPLFQSNRLRLRGRCGTIGRDGKHVKFAVANGSNRSMEAVGFGLAHRLPLLEKSAREGLPIDIAYSVHENTWRGISRLQLRVEDVRISPA